ncbi:MAG: hypothetical protein NC434_10225 [Ruminococcus sp.]|nr:hypothetical protein [Ruminococcus sp.]
MSYINFIASLNEKNKVVVYHALAENRLLSNEEWEDILMDLSKYRNNINCTHEIHILLTELNTKDKEIFKNILLQSNNHASALKKIYTFEDIMLVDIHKVKETLKTCDFLEVVTACVGTSPDNIDFIDKLYGESKLKVAVMCHDSIPISSIETCQRNIINKINELL